MRNIEYFKKFIAWAALMLFVFYAASKAEATEFNRLIMPVLCTENRSDMVDFLVTFKELPQMRAKSKTVDDTDLIMHLAFNEDKTQWTLFVEDVTGRYCVVLVGTAFQFNVR
jgi:hypothetical protein